MTPQIILAERCHWCSRGLPPGDLRRLSSGQNMCRRCYEWHLHALAVRFGRAVPLGCQECGITVEQLNAIQKAATNGMNAVKMYVVPKDGVYQVLCLTCKEAYCAKRADLYRGTEFGHEVLKLA